MVIAYHLPWDKNIVRQPSFVFRLLTASIVTVLFDINLLRCRTSNKNEKNKTS